MADLPLYDPDERNDPLVHVQALFNSLSDEDGWRLWSVIATVTRKSGAKQDLDNMTSNKEDGYLNLLKFLQETHELDVSKEDLKVNRDENNRTSFLPERREMMQKWSDYLDTLLSDQIMIYTGVFTQFG